MKAAADWLLQQYCRATKHGKFDGEFLVKTGVMSWLCTRCNVQVFSEAVAIQGRRHGRQRYDEWRGVERRHVRVDSVYAGPERRGAGAGARRMA